MHFALTPETRDSQAKALYPMGDRICYNLPRIHYTPQTKNNLVDSSSRLRPKPNPKPQAKSVVQCPKPNPEGLARAFHLALAKLRAAKLPSPAPQSKKGPPRGPGLERIGGDWVQRWMGAIHFAPLENHGEIIACWLSGQSERDAERAGTNELSEGRIVTEILPGRFCMSFRPCLLLHSSAKSKHTGLSSQLINTPGVACCLLFAGAGESKNCIFLKGLRLKGVLFAGLLAGLLFQGPSQSKGKKREKKKKKKLQGKWPSV